jgi:hypothetical protein
MPVKMVAGPPNGEKPKWHGVRQRQATSRKYGCGSSGIGPIRICRVKMMTTIETFNRGDEVLSKFPGGSIMTVLAVEGLKVRCSDDQNRQYWFDTNLLERYHWTPSGPDGVEQDSRFLPSYIQTVI